MSVRLVNSCFVHIPRTGGTWLKKAVMAIRLHRQTLSGDLDGHLPWSVLSRHWPNLIGFTFVRHPFAWLRSRWSHAIHINAAEDGRHFGVHRLFDVHVRPSFADTVAAILRQTPGIVGITYKTMAEGIPPENLVRTEDLPNGAGRLLVRLEGISGQSCELLRNVPPCNSTSSLARYQKEMANLPARLEEEFLESERIALDIWNNVGGNTA